MKISVIGAGSRGLALSDVLAFNGNDVLVYARDIEAKNEINDTHTSLKYLNGYKINSKILATDNLCEVLHFSNYLLLAVPSSAIVSCLNDIKSTKKKEGIHEDFFFINAIKGLNLETKQTIQQIINEKFPNRKGLVSVLGPGFAKEVLNQNITCICSVSENEREALFVQALFSNNYFRLYSLTDVIGAELYSSIKNALAIASGIVNGLGYGTNTIAALITMGLKEMASIGNIMGAKEETFFGLTGLGDLILTCSSEESRNFQAGYQIGKDDSAKLFLKHNKTTVEGIATVAVIEEIAKKNKLELPILHSLYLILYKDIKPSDVLKKIMKRPLKSEG